MRHSPGGGLLNTAIMEPAMTSCAPDSARFADMATCAMSLCSQYKSRKSPHYSHRIHRPPLACPSQPMDPAHNYWPINPHDHHHLLSLCSLQPQPQSPRHNIMNTLSSTTSISDQHVSLKYSSISSLESAASHYSYNHCYDAFNSPNYASLISSLPSSAVYNTRLAPSSDYNQGSSIQIIEHESEAESIPGCPRAAPSPRPPEEEQQKYYSYAAHTQDPSAQLVSLITPPICPDSFLDMNSPASLNTHSSSSNSTFPTQVGFKPWTRQPYEDIQIMQGTPRSSCSLLKKCLRWVLPSLARRELRGQLMNSPRGSGGLIDPTNLLISHELPSACTHSMSSKLNYSNISTTGEDNAIALQEKEAAEVRQQHMVAERKRRQKQSESFKALLSVVPSITKKADKVTILKRTIQHIKQLQDRVDELQEHKRVLLMQAPIKPAMIGTTTGVMVGSQQFLSTPTHSEDPLTSSQTDSFWSVSSPETHSDLVVTSQAGGQLPLFHIKINITVQPAEANDTIIKTVSGLKDKKLHCIHVKSEFSAENSHLSAKILAKFKDGDNSTPSDDEIMEIKEWWRQLRHTFFTRGREEP